MPLCNGQQVGQREQGAKRLGIFAAIFRDPRQAELGRKLFRQHRFSGAFRAMKTDTLHARAKTAARRWRRSASIHSLSPNRLITNIPA